MIGYGLVNCLEVGQKFVVSSCERGGKKHLIMSKFNNVKIKCHYGDGVSFLL